jgi:hypothetical protein
MGRANLKAALLVMALLAAACTGQASGSPSSKPRSVPVSPTGTTGTSPANGSATATRDPQVIVDALDAAGMALCHADYSDGAQYNIYGILGASGTWRFFPHHSAAPVPTNNGEVLSCVTANQPNTGAVEIDVYPSAADASAALRQVGHIWLDAWLYGNVAILVDQTTPPPVAQQVHEVLDHLPGTTQFR